MEVIPKEQIIQALGEFPAILIGLSAAGDVVFKNDLAESIIKFSENSKIQESSIINKLFPLQKQRDIIKNFVENPKNSIVNLPEGELIDKYKNFLLINWSLKSRSSDVIPGIKFWLIGQDSTQSFIIRKKLIESEQKFNFVSKATNDAIYDWDAINDILTWNDGMSNLFGHDETKIEHTQNWWNLHIHSDDLIKIQLSLSAAFESTGNFWSEEYRFLTQDGKYADVRDRAFFIRNETGKVVRMIGGLQDISEIKKIELKLLEKNRKLSEIAFFNSHKLRAPLARILGLVSTIDPEEESLSPELTDIIKKLHDSTKELDLMVKEMGKLTNI